MTALFCHFFDQAQAAGVQSIGAPAPSQSRQIFEGLGCSVRRWENNNTMFLITNFGSLLTRIKPLLETRLRDSDFSGWSGAIRICYEADEQTLVIRDGAVNIEPNNASPEIDLRVSQTQLLKLLFGNMSAAQVVFSNSLQISEVSLLDALFPAGELFMWRTDRF